MRWTKKAATVKQQKVELTVCEWCGVVVGDEVKHERVCQVDPEASLSPNPIPALAEIPVVVTGTPDPVTGLLNREA